MEENGSVLMCNNSEPQITLMSEGALNLRELTNVGDYIYFTYLQEGEWNCLRLVKGRVVDKYSCLFFIMEEDEHGNETKRTCYSWTDYYIGAPYDIKRKVNGTVKEILSVEGRHWRSDKKKHK